MPEAPDVVTFGEIMAMFVATDHRPLSEVDHFEQRLAGAEMNVAVGLARLGHRVGYLGQVGPDPFGTRARETLAGEGVDVSALRTEPSAPTGFQLKNRVHSGDPTVVYFRRGSAASSLGWSPSAHEVIGAARHLHVTGIFPALSAETRDFTFRAIATARAAGATVSFDPNLRPSLWRDSSEMTTVVNDLAARADWVLPGLAEGRTLTGATSAERIADFYLDRGVSQVVVKLGTDGALLRSRDGTLRAPAFPVRAVDTVGAGDGFAAGWISARLEGVEQQRALRRACAVGAITTTSEGDMDGLPSRVHLDTVLAEGETARQANGAGRATTSSA
ncbi:sugar/nucleoside kinase (ribokinase family) [Saccharopolyspora lacisalsi]|uniref:Sugar/nucleoside kinase (Ribokinase family) n=1 Tax=Halosaccharopolyspora lacisalsi TaxID=1000566 RepID=A0A839DNP3_9PSEU|nr:sugar kinase [Halosaccharopolyspora lacisalsi]MBA8823592.1 sugar/nucleoside kinase (ribokinase family) [Halosaccharopolyspora lacisalsi]